MGVGKPRGILAGRKLKTKRRAQKCFIKFQVERQGLQQKTFGIQVEKPFHGCFSRQGSGGGEDGC